VSINNIVNAGNSGNTGPGFAMQFDADSAFSGKLHIGELLQGKVTQRFDGNRYAVNFGGTEKIVDSAIPLTSGELIHGRVVGLNDKVHLQRVYPEKSDVVREPATRSRNQTILQELFAQYKTNLSPSAKANVLPLMKAHPKPVAVALSSLILNKLGLPAEPLFLRAVTKVLAGDQRATTAHHLKAAPELKTDLKSAMRTDPYLISELASAIALLSDPNPSRMAKQLEPAQGSSAESVQLDNRELDTGEANGSLDEQSGDSDEQLGRWILNAQNTSSVSHRMARLPIWFGENLVEVDVALFSQRDATVKGDGVRHRKIVLSLQTQQLGLVEVCIYAADQHLRLHFTAESEQVSGILASHLEDARIAVDALGWTVDEVSYTTQTLSADRLMQSVTQHYVANDSLNRVM
jgi:hypothetical protein